MKTLLIIVFASLNFLSSQINRQLLPSEALILTYEAMDSNPDKKRIEAIGHILPRVISKDLNGDELFYLGDIYFWNFKPDESAAAFKHFLKEKGIRGRASWQRNLQIQFRAYEKHDYVEKQLEVYRKQFKAIPQDRYGLFGQVWNLASRYEKLGEYSRVLRLISDEIKSLNYKGAYRSFNLPAYFNKSYRELGKTKEAIRLMETAIKGLRKTLKERQESVPKKVTEFVIHTSRVRRMHTVMTEKLNYIQTNKKFEELINNLNTSIQKFKSLN